MDPTKMITYVSFEEIFGRRSSFDEFKEYLVRYSKESVIYVCCLIGSLLEFWKRGAADYKYYDVMIRSTFDPILAAKLIQGAKVRTPAFVFHRRQLLLVEKSALLYCPEYGVDVLKDRPGLFGLVLLMANDHFHYARPSDTSQELEQNLLAEFVAVNEFSGSRVLTTTARARVMRNEIAPTLNGHSCYVDIHERFASLTGLTLESFEKLCMAAFTKYNAITLAQLQLNGDDLYLRGQWFATLRVPSDKMARFVDEIGATEDEYLASFKAKKHFGHNDFTALKDRPIYLEGRGGLPLDLLFVVDKFATGPFWRIHNAIASGTARQGFRSFWGAVFEKYVHRIMERSCKPPQNQYLPNPTFELDGTEACDAVILRNEVLICLEYKANMFTAEAKYSGEPQILLGEIRRKLIENEEGKKKGISQLAATISKLFRTSGSEELKGINISHIRKIYPVLVTLDDIGGSFLVTRHLGEAFKDALGASDLTVEVMPLFSMNIEALEVLSAYLGFVALDTVLNEWHSKDPALASSILAVDHPALESSAIRKNAVLAKEFRSIFKELVDSLEQGVATSEQIGAIGEAKLEEMR